MFACSEYTHSFDVDFCIHGWACSIPATSTTIRAADQVVTPVGGVIRVIRHEMDTRTLAAGYESSVVELGGNLLALAQRTGQSDPAITPRAFTDTSSEGRRRNSVDSSTDCEDLTVRRGHDPSRARAP